MGPKKEAHQPTRGWCAPFGQEAELERVWGCGPPFPSLLLLLPFLSYSN